MPGSTLPTGPAAFHRGRRGHAGLIAATLILLYIGPVHAQGTRFATTDSRSRYAHWIDLYDAAGKKIDPTQTPAPPYSPATTCGKCHEYETIAGGYHFNACAAANPAGRPGEPWVWTEPRTGTQIPVSYRGWRGTHRPAELGISPWQFVIKFGSHLAGDVLSEPAPALTSKQPGRWKLAGRLAIDCMICHSGDRSYSPETRSRQIAAENFAWAATAAVGLARIDGIVKSLPDDFDPSAADQGRGGRRLPAAHYYPTRFNAEKKAFFDVVREPANSACYYCHTVRPVGRGQPPDWTRDEDVHVAAGISCTGCHGNGLGHQTVRGHEGEQHPAGQWAATRSCRGCHLGSGGDGTASAGGHFGAPRPLHKGLPPLHLEKMSCTSCHSGPAPSDQPRRVQTAMAHQLGLPAHRKPDQMPLMVEPVLLRDPDGVLYPHRMLWPAFWGTLTDDGVRPLDPEQTYRTLRRVLRVRRDFRKEVVRVRLSDQERAAVLGPDRAKVADDELSPDERDRLQEAIDKKAAERFPDKLAAALKKLAGSVEGTPVYVCAGKVYRLDQQGQVETFQDDAAEPCAWPLAHDVRPARQALGAGGCTDCHADGAPVFYATVTAQGPAPDSTPKTVRMYELAGLDPDLLAVWNRSFAARDLFKLVGLVSVGVVALVLLVFILSGLAVLLRLASGARNP